MRLTWWFSLKSFVCAIWFGKKTAHLAILDGQISQKKFLPAHWVPYHGNQMSSWPERPFARFISLWASWTLCVKAFLLEGIWSLLHVWFIALFYSASQCITYKSPGVIASLSEPWNLRELFLAPAWLLKLLQNVRAWHMTTSGQWNWILELHIPLVSLSHSVVMPEYLYMWKMKNMYTLE